MCLLIVSFMAKQQIPIDRVFYALSDVTRMAVLKKLSYGPATVSELAQHFDMALPSFTQHLGILEECRLVSSEKEGRVRTYQLEMKSMRRAEDWIQKRLGKWEEKLEQLEVYLAEMQE